MSSNFDLVIFDCDGVLVDSEVISCRAHAETLTRHGYPITPDQVLERFSACSTAQGEFGSRSRTRPRAFPTIFKSQMKQDDAAVATPAICKPYSTYHEAIAAISLPKCVASSGSRRRNSLTASACAGLYDRLAPHIFSASQVKRGKPAPDLFLFAAGQMQAAPARCLVIEDSVPGVTGAVAAGMTVLGFHGGSHCRPGHGDRLRAAGAAAMFDDMRQLPGLIGRIGAKFARHSGVTPASTRNLRFRVRCWRIAPE